MTRIFSCLFDYSLVKHDITACTIFNSAVLLIQTKLNDLCKWLEINSLQINVDKTKFVIFHKAADLEIPNDIKLNCNGIEIERVYTFRYLGVIIDANVNFKSHLQYVKKRVNSAIGVLNTIKRFIPFDVFCIFLNAYVLSIVDYCLPIYGAQTENDLQSVQNSINRAIKMYCEPPKWLRNKKTPTFESDLLEKVGILSVRERIQFYLTKLTFKALKYKTGIKLIDSLF